MAAHHDPAPGPRVWRGWGMGFGGGDKFHASTEWPPLRITAFRWREDDVGRRQVADDRLIPVGPQLPPRIIGSVALAQLHRKRGGFPEVIKAPLSDFELFPIS